MRGPQQRKGLYPFYPEHLVPTLIPSPNADELLQLLRLNNRQSASISTLGTVLRCKSRFHCGTDSLEASILSDGSHEPEDAIWGEEARGAVSEPYSVL